MRAYLAELDKHRAPAPENTAEAAGSLRTRFLNWFTAQPEPTRNRPYTMQEIEIALQSQGRFISPVLIAEGWARKRKWANKRHYHRLWLPPQE